MATVKGTGAPSSILRIGGFVPTIMAGARTLNHYNLLRHHPELEHAPYNPHTISAQYAAAVAVRILSSHALYRAKKFKAHQSYTGDFLLLMVHLIILTYHLLTTECNLRNGLC